MGLENKTRLLLRRLNDLMGDKGEEIIGKAIEAQEDLMADLNREQLQEGTRPDGSAITPAYKPATIEIKQRKGQPTNRVTLRDTGSYQDKINYRKSGGIFEGHSDDPKAEELREKYGQTIGVNDHNLVVVSQAMLPDVRRRVRKYLKIN